MPLVYRPTLDGEGNSPYDQVLNFHAGLPKTATSFLQARYFPCHEQIVYLGKNHHDRGFLAPEIQKFVVETLRQRVFECDVAVARQLFDEHVRPLMGRQKAIVLSMEDGTHGTRRRRRAKIRNLRAACGPCRLLITMRNPLDYVQSMYFQTIKRVNTGPHHRRVKPWLPELETWLEERWNRDERGELSHLDYADYIADWQDAFGPDSVGILLFEDLKRQPQTFIDRLSAWLGVRSVDAAALAEGPTVNPSWTPAQLERLRRIKGSRLATLRFYFATREERLRMLGDVKGPSARAPLSDVWRRRFCEATQAGNRRLAEQYDLPLAELGYPL